MVEDAPFVLFTLRTAFMGFSMMTADGDFDWKA